MNRAPVNLALIADNLSTADLVFGGLIFTLLAFTLVSYWSAVRPNKEDGPLETLLVRDQLKDERAKYEQLLAAAQDVDYKLTLAVEENARVWDLAAKLAGLLGYTDFEASVERLEKMPGIDDPPSLYLRPVLKDGELVAVEPTNDLKLAYVEWMHYPADVHVEKVEPARLAMLSQTAQQQTGASSGQLTAAGMVPPP